MARVKIAEFGIIQKALRNAVVTFYGADDNGENTGVKVTIYQASTGTGARENPQTLDENGKLSSDCYVEEDVVASITGINEPTERSLKKIKQNPLEFGLPVTSSAFYAASTLALTAAAAVSAAAALVSENSAAADAILTAADVVTTGNNVASTAADVVTSNNNVTACQAAQTASELAQTAAEAAASGMVWRPSVKAATTGNITLFGAQTIDGISVVADDRVLVKDQSSAPENGVYICAAGAWSRATDADTWDELVSQVVSVEEGSANADTSYICTVDSGGTLESSNVTWSSLGVPANSVSNTKLADMATQTVKGRNTAGTGDPEDLSMATLASMLSVGYPQGYKYGGILSNNVTDSDHDIDISVGAFRDSADAVNMALSAITKRIDATWASGTGNGGLSSSLTAPANNTWYHVFAIIVSGSVDVGFDTSLTAANLVTDHSATAYRYIGSVRTDGLANIIPFIQRGSRFTWVTAVSDLYANTTGTAANTLAITAPPSTTADITAYIMGWGGSVNAMVVTSLDQADVTPTQTTVGQVADSGFSTQKQSVNMNVDLNSSSQLRYRCSNSSVSLNVGIITNGWEVTEWA